MEERNLDCRWIFVYSLCLVGLLVNGTVLLGLFFCTGVVILLKSLF